MSQAYTYSESDEDWAKRLATYDKMEKEYQRWYNDNKDEIEAELVKREEKKQAEKEKSRKQEAERVKRQLKKAEKEAEECRKRLNEL